ncbi:hypothetical protein HRI_004347400 [Hibiscus trionum]|uniref:HMA domain-containing protein n=1 Tax=Hibiscus trionum TaxID=183268 RepID=A0A9W7J514_HIBTR|nr:hypothetical protein HRI_004347400 [Hibiscus trionum]
MESALSTTPFSISKTLNLHLPIPKSPLFSLSYPSPLRIASASDIPKRLHRRLKCLGDSEAKVGVGAADAIILNVGGMTCGGCVSSVKKILESRPQVSSASVDLSTETAIVWPVSEAKALPNWQKELGEALAKHLTSCGFESIPRGGEAIEGGVWP